jgi:hypothetical protein
MLISHAIKDTRQTFNVWKYGECILLVTFCSQGKNKMNAYHTSRVRLPVSVFSEITKRISMKFGIRGLSIKSWVENLILVSNGPT